MIAGVPRAVVALLPLALVPVLVHLIANGGLDLGGGETDLVWVLVWLLWSVLFAISSLVLWHRGWPVARSVVRSMLVGLAGVLMAAILLALFGQLGVAGRF
jgi:hypothetical protein